MEMQQNEINNQVNSQKLKDTEIKFQENALDFLNLMFGKGE
jgi:hypothetical protein